MPSARTIVSYRPTPDEEGLLDALSQKLGLSKSRTLAFALRRIAEEEKVIVSTTVPTSEELAAIHTLYEELTPEYWNRRRILEGQQRRGALTTEEQEELFALIEQGEAWNVKRLAFFFDLASRYQKPHDYFLDSLGLRHHPLAVRPQ